MRTRTWVIFIGVNVIVSAVVMLMVLFAWDHIRNFPTPTPASALLSTRGAASPPSTLAVSSPSPLEPLQYTVQEGDTLGAIAQIYGLSMEDLMAANEITDPNLLQIGQTLVIPSTPLTSPTTGPSVETSPEPATTGSSPTPFPTLTPAGSPLIEIGQVLASGDLATEVVVVRNQGGAVSLEGWTLSDADGNTFTFPTITLFADVQMRLHSIPGRSTPSDLYWGREAPAWNEGELITLRDRTGNVVDTYIVP